MRLLVLLCVGLLTSGCYDSHFGEPEGSSAAEPTVTTIGELRDNYAGTTFQITSDLVVWGVVTTSDHSRNYFRTLCIEQQGAALELMAGIDHLHNDYPVGSRVTLRLKGLVLSSSHGVLQTGRKPAPGSGFATDYLGSVAALYAVLTRNSEQLDPVTPARHTIASLRPEFCGTLISIEGLRYTPEDLTPSTWSGYKRFTDDAGNAIFTYVRSYADFADREVPAGNCSLTGILQQDGARYLLKLRDEGDCAH